MMRLLPAKWIWIILAFLAACVSAYFILEPALRINDRLRGYGQKLGLLPPPLPQFHAQIIPLNHISSRAAIITDLQAALDRGDYRAAAYFNGILSQEAFRFANRLNQTWKEVAQTTSTGLTPYAWPSRFYAYWDWNSAADNFSWQWVASLSLDPGAQSVWQNQMDLTAEICGDLFCSIWVNTGQIKSVDQTSQIFGTAEFLKDGLMALTERFGPGPWLDRMIEYTGALIELAPVSTSYGAIPSNGTEKNGEMLQVLVRLYWITHNERYLEMAERIADVYLFDVIPNNGGWPADYWDFQTNRPLAEDRRFRPAAEVDTTVYPFRLVDHGGEIIPGLVELYYLEKSTGRPAADRYRQPIQSLLNALLASGRNEQGLFIQSIDTQTLKPYDARPNDTWGYLLNAYQIFDLAEGTHTYSQEIQKVMSAVARQHSIEWENQLVDGYSDTIESMLYLLPFYPSKDASQWIDEEMEVIYEKHQENGFVEGWYLDGNVIRTELMYARYKTQGILPSPWTENLRVGAAYDPRQRTLYINARSQTRWEGQLVFDQPRHKTIFGQPEALPRVNAEPEWYVIDSAKRYQITNLDNSEVKVYSGQVLADGLPVTLTPDQPDGLNLTVVEVN